MGRCQKLGIILENKVISKLIFFNAKKLRKIFESQILALLTPSHYTHSQNSMISFGYVDFQAFFFSDFVPPLENSTRKLKFRKIKICTNYAVKKATLIQRPLIRGP
jgi:hypothetical protein